jgi:hypothetical protein
MKYVELITTDLREHLDACIRNGLGPREAFSKTAEKAMSEAHKLLHVSEVLGSADGNGEVEADLAKESGFIFLSVPEAVAAILVAEGLARESEYQEETCLPYRQNLDVPKIHSQGGT